MPANSANERIAAACTFDMYQCSKVRNQIVPLLIANQ